MSTVTMQELELEHAELLPCRETLWVHSSPSVNLASVANGNGNGNGDGNTHQFGLLNISALNGNGNGNFNGNGNETIIVQK